MKYILAFVFSLTSTLINSQQELFDLEVTVDNVASSEGTVRIGLFTNKEDFLTTSIKSGEVDAETTAVSHVFKGLPRGIYAISIFHDENDNGKLDSNFMGIPNEPYAFSNNAKGTFGPPSFEDCKFEVKQSSSVTISL